MTSALGKIVARHPGQVVVAVSHADPIKAAVAQALGTPLDLFQRIMLVSRFAEVGNISTYLSPTSW